MSKISSYPTDDIPTTRDYLLGTDGDDNSKTKQFRLSDVIAVPDYDQSFSYGITTGVPQTFMMKMVAKYAIVVQSVVMAADASMTGVAIKINDTAIGGMSAINVTTSPVETQASAENIVSIGDTITLETTGTDGGATMLQVELNYKRV